MAASTSRESWTIVLGLAAGFSAVMIWRGAWDRVVLAAAGVVAAVVLLVLLRQFRLATKDRR